MKYKKIYFKCKMFIYQYIIAHLRCFKKYLSIF
nr:MAG TPA: hypothetical protein [Caudoviricetes sp.]